MAALPDALFQADAFLTLSGSTALVWVIVNGVRVFSGFYRKWLILAVSTLVVFAAGTIGRHSWSLQQILLLLGNSFLLALTASGAQETAANVATPPTNKQYGKRTYRWLESWFD